MPTTFGTLVLNYICPSLGVILSCAMNSAPVEELRRAVARGHLADLNPIPFACMTGNTLGWVAYSFLIRNPFVLFANAPGLLVSVWLNMGAIKLEYLNNMAEPTSPALARKSGGGGRGEDRGELKPQFSRLESTAEFVREATYSDITTQQGKYVIVVVLAWLIILSVVAMFPMAQPTKEIVVGVSANLNLVFFFGAPLSTVVEVLKARDSSSIHRRTLALNTVNASFWTMYGVTITDPFIVLPNATGVMLGIVQAFLCVRYPAARGGHGDDPGSASGKLVSDTSGMGSGRYDSVSSSLSNVDAGDCDVTANSTENGDAEMKNIL